jgi:hypothetical protein
MRRESCGESFANHLQRGEYPRAEDSSRRGPSVRARPCLIERNLGWSGRAGAPGRPFRARPAVLGQQPTTIRCSTYGTRGVTGEYHLRTGGDRPPSEHASPPNSASVPAEREGWVRQCGSDRFQRATLMTASGRRHSEEVHVIRATLFCPSKKYCPRSTQTQWINPLITVRCRVVGVRSLI